MQYRWPIAATVAWVALFYRFIGRQLRTKYAVNAELSAKGKSFDRYSTGDGRMRAADRTVGNLLEQAPAFLCSLWLHAIFVNPESQLGLVYVGLRLMYPVLLGSTVGGLQSKRVAFVTFPCYCIVAYMLSSTMAVAFPSAYGLWPWFAGFWVVFLGLGTLPSSPF